MQEELLDFLRNPFLLFSVTFLLAFCVVDGSQQLGEVVELEFQAYRLRQYEVNGNFYGSKNFKVSYEAVSLDAKAIRKCVVTTWRELLSDVEDVWSLGTGAVLIFIPADLDVLNDVDRKDFMDFEKKMLSVSSELAIYVSPLNENAETVLNDVTSKRLSSTTAFQTLVNSISGNTIQLTSKEIEQELPKNYKPQNIVGRLTSSERGAPTIAFVAHYDTSSVVPGLSAGSDSNGSGVVALLELLAVLSKFYDKPSTRPPYNLLFIWTAAGKINYQGARHWIDEYQRGNEDEKMDLAICLESIGQVTEGLHMHVSKVPKETSVAANIFRRLKEIVPNNKMEMVSKKISLTSGNSWEHEKFNIKRMPAVTISTLPSPNHVSRNSILDNVSSINEDELIRNIKSIAEAVIGYILNLPESGPSTDSRVTSESTMLSKDAVDKQRVHHFIRQFASKPRPVSDKLATETTVANIAAAASSYAPISTTGITITDAKIFGVTKNIIVAERVKPAVFELIIASGVFGYFTIIYYIAINAQSTIEKTVGSLRKFIF